MQIKISSRLIIYLLSNIFLSPIIIIVLFLLGTPIFTESKLKIACIGDSITYGGGIKERTKNSYPAKLQSFLGDQFDVKNFGVGGATILRKGDRPYWKQKAFFESLRFYPDIVLIKFGTNDSKTFQWDSDAYKQDYKDFISLYKNLNPDVKVFLLIPVPAFIKIWDIQPSVMEKEIPSILKELSLREGLPIIDLHTEFLDKPELFFDKIHPNAKGAQLIAEIVHTHIIKY
jgi:acyl-CoA thioesterase I